MRARLLPLVVGCCLLGTGCTLMQDATHLTLYRAGERVSEYRERKRNRQWAAEAWERARGCGAPASEHYGAGFREGFAEFLYKGGNGEPPPLPPKHYRHLRYQTPEGYRAVEDWFAGYRHGAAAAREGGFRDLVTGPSALRSAPGPHGPVPEPLDGAAVPVVTDAVPAPGPAPPGVPATELLPPTPAGPPVPSADGGVQLGQPGPVPGGQLQPDLSRGVRLGVPAGAVPEPGPVALEPTPVALETPPAALGPALAPGDAAAERTPAAGLTPPAAGPAVPEPAPPEAPAVLILPIAAGD